MVGHGVHAPSGKLQMAIDFLRNTGTDPLENQLLLQGGLYGHL